MLLKILFSVNHGVTKAARLHNSAYARTLPSKRMIEKSKQYKKTGTQYSTDIFTHPHPSTTSVHSRQVVVTPARALASLQRAVCQVAAHRVTRCPSLPAKHLEQCRFNRLSAPPNAIGNILAHVRSRQFFFGSNLLS